MTAPPHPNVTQFRTLRRSLGTQALVAGLTGWSVRAIQALEGGQNPVKEHHLLVLRALMATRPRPKKAKPYEK